VIPAEPPGAAGVGGSDALVDGEGLTEGCGAFGDAAVVEVTATDAFQGALPPAAPISWAMVSACE
jgi:hypothetical protein